MENFYLAIVVVLFILAISDLIVGVSNDAVNFLNSAIGAKVAPLRVIMLVSALGVLMGATFSSGMMEVARSGIFHPETFTFHEVMYIFLAVMITDVILLDLFNTFGLPTSTTVSIVFELLGSSVAIALIKINHDDLLTLGNLSDFINTGGALVIISGILLSVAIAFIFGLVVQYISRVIFSFSFKRTLRYFGSVWGGLAITAITFFILIKGAKGSAFLNDQRIKWISENSKIILLFCFIGWTVIMQLLYWLFKVNVFKVVVLFGTFALAMAFAGNDMVNFIGVPIAGYQSFKIFSAQSNLDANSLTMGALNISVKTELYFLIITGLIMVLTLYFSRKARGVVRTSLDLSRQDEVNERFSSSPLARSLVRLWIQAGTVIKKIIPDRVLAWLDKRFDDKAFKKQVKKDKEVSFDMVRAAVNLAVSSSLIALATSYKLPLSTTYVTFMAAMGSSLADKAWGRESAVYRISGVITIIAGWFFTAFMAFTISFLLAGLIFYGGVFAIAGLIFVAVFIIIKTHAFFKKREKVKKAADEILITDPDMNPEKAFESCNLRVISSLYATGELYKNMIEGITGEKRKKLKKALSDTVQLNKEVKSYKKNAHDTVKLLQETESVETGDTYVQLLDYLRETAHCLNYIVQPAFDHTDNNHGPLKKADADDLKTFEKDLQDFLQKVIKVITDQKYTDIDKLNSHMNKLLDDLTKMRKSHLKRLKAESLSTRLSILYLDILAESKNLLLFIINIAKSSRDFYNEANKKALRVTAN